jgi:hypothetical protein
MRYRSCYRISTKKGIDPRVTMIIKFQITNPKFQISPNDQNLNYQNKKLFRSLEFGVCLLFGAWNL